MPNQEIAGTRISQGRAVRASGCVVHDSPSEGVRLASNAEWRLCGSLFHLSERRFVAAPAREAIVECLPERAGKQLIQGGYDCISFRGERSDALAQVLFGNRNDFQGV